MENLHPVLPSHCTNHMVVPHTNPYEDEEDEGEDATPDEDTNSYEEDEDSRPESPDEDDGKTDKEDELNAPLDDGKTDELNAPLEDEVSLNTPCSKM